MYRSALIGATVLAAGIVTATPATAHTAHPAHQVPACRSADVHVGYRHGDDGMGHIWGWIVLRNTSDHRCVTGGYGGISYVGHGDGTQIGAPADRDPGVVRSYVLRPGQRLRSVLQQTRAANYPRQRCRPVHVDGFRVYIPNETRSQYVPHPTRGCANPHVHLLSHRPFRRP
jgi:hypothetical protein